jgi:CxxC motif-containing protein (DUF1111 family)
MKLAERMVPHHIRNSIEKFNTSLRSKLILGNAILLVLSLASVVATQGQNTAHDPGPRGGTINAGQPLPGLSFAELTYFQDGQDRFSEVDSVSGTVKGEDGSGLGPGFNANSCAACHAQPAEGGSSPSVSAFPNIGPNPQIAQANLDGAANIVPSFVAVDGPVCEARFKFAVDANGNLTDSPDGGVHDLFTIQGRTDAPGCQLPQPNFQQMQDLGNVVFRIPTPTFGLGLVENISEYAIMNNAAANAAARQALGISGHVNRSGNDGTITRFGWKGQNKSLLMFAGEAYNVEQGVSNELFGNERGVAPPATPPANCIFNQTPEDRTNFAATRGGRFRHRSNPTTEVLSDLAGFANFMRFLDQPRPACSGKACPASIQNGRNLFVNVVQCALCHTPTLKTTASGYSPAMSNANANLFSDLMVHHMGSGLADGVGQGNAGLDEFRSAPLWGLGQRVFFLHDGRTSDLLQAILAHASDGSEANQVINNFNSLTESQKQDLLNFLRSL